MYSFKSLVQEATPLYKYLGCYKDKRSRAIKGKKVRSNQNEPHRVISQCYNIALAKVGIMMGFGTDSKEPLLLHPLANLKSLVARVEALNRL